ncbi:hypothetical protein ACHAXS_008376 [Conticribra weissflogii]
MGNQMAKEISGTLSNPFGKGHRSNPKSNGRNPINASANGASATREEPRRLPKDFVLLEGCSTLEEHEAKIRWVIDTITNEDDQRGSGPLQGEEGLRAIGFEFRFVPCKKCAPLYEDPCCHGISGDYLDEMKNTGDDDEGSSRGEAENAELAANANSQILAAPVKRISWKPSISSVSNASTSNSNNSTGATDSNNRNDPSTWNKRKFLSRTSFDGSFLEKSSSCGADESDAESAHYIPNCTNCHDCVTRLFYIGDPYSFGKAASTGVAIDAYNANSSNVCSSLGNGEMAVNSMTDSVDKTSISSKGPQLSTESSSSCQDDEPWRKECNQQTSSLPNTAADNTSSTVLPQSQKSGASSLIHSGETTIELTEQSTASEKLQAIRTSAETTKITPTSTSLSTPPQALIAITTQNRQKYIADGHMYDLLASLAQQATHQYMIRTFHLSWVTICNNPKRCGAEQEPIRALVDEDHRLVYKRGCGKVVLTEKSEVTMRLEKELEQEQARDADDIAMTGREEKKDDFDHETTNTNVTNINQTTTTTTATAATTTAKHGKMLRRKSTFHNREKKGTLLIATGRGKVRAGIFSRQHILTSGIEVGSAWHMIREARMRGMGVAIIDPNARGEGLGMETFETSVSRLFSEDDDGVFESDCANNNAYSSSSNTPQSLYILAHSASGGQLVRHLRQDPALLPSIKAIAFTDSTHNVQWCKHDPRLKEMLESKNCVYLRSNEVRSGGSHVRVSSRGKEIGGACAAAAFAASSSSSSSSLTSSLRGEGNNPTASTLHKDPKSAGKPAETDHFWEHRFGKIKTLWAGTAEHSLSNWAGHDQIWDHFDEHATDGEDENENDDDGDG